MRETRDGLLMEREDGRGYQKREKELGEEKLERKRGGMKDGGVSRVQNG